MKKVFFWASIFLCTFTLLSAKQISQTQSLDVAIELFSSIKKLKSDSHFQLVYTAYDKSSGLRAEETALYYIYNIDDQGFVIISADDCVYPVIAYSLSGKYDPDNCAPGFTVWMNDTESGISEAVRVGKEPDDRIVKAWEAFLSGNSGSLRSFQSVSKMTQAEWGQRSPYSDNCPVYRGKNTVSGCVATAMAQVMYFWKYPLHGIGKSSPYDTETYSISVPSVNYATTEYRWNDMTSKYDSGSEQEAKNAVATLMYHCGVSIETDYGTDESSAYVWDVGNALMNAFGYDKGINYKLKDYYSYSEWRNFLLKEISEGRPVLYGGQSADEGHAFVCDGYDDYGFFHFNWGWDGIDNGYFNIEGNFNYSGDNELIIGIQPDRGNPSSFEMVVGPSVEKIDTEGLTGSQIELIKKYSSVRSETTQIKQNENFTVGVSLWNIGYGIFKGEIGFVLLDSKYNFIECIGSLSRQVFANSELTGLITLNCKISANVPDGDYYVKAAVKPQQGEWQPVNADIGNRCIGEIKLKVGNPNGISNINKDEEIRIYAENKNLILETPYNEDIYIYNSLGNKIQQFKKDAGKKNISITIPVNDIIIVKGSSGWVKKVFVN